jgi:alginate O-acetyltransferase complex protein AlgJ
MEAGARMRIRPLLEWILIAAFAGALAAPSIDPYFRSEAARTALVEFRSPAELPEHPVTIPEWQAYPAAFEAWFNDHFGLRDKLVRWHNELDWYGFGISPTSKLVLGDDAWVYYADDKSLEVYRGAYPLSPNELEGWRRALTARRDWLAARKIRYLFAIVPNKDQVYPEHLPASLAKRGTTRSDQVIAYLRERSDLDVLDLRPALLAEKQNDREGDYVYYRLGTHWTGRGAYAAYAALIDRMKTYFPKLEALPRESFRITPEGEGDNWAPHLYMEDLLKQTNLEWHVRRSARAKYEAGVSSTAESFESTNSDASLPSAFILHDSFGPVLRPWMAENLSHARWSSGWGIETHLEELHADPPDIVIELFVDRIFVQNYPQVALTQGAGPRKRAFDKSRDVRLRLDPAHGFAGLLTSGKAQMHVAAEASPPSLVLQCPTVTDGVLIPAIDFPPSTDVMVAIAMNSPTVSALDLFFQKTTEPGFERRRACQEKIYKGPNVVYFRLFAGNLAGRMFLHFRDRGEYRIQSIEIRAVHE